MDKVLIGKMPAYPSTMVIAGALVNGRENYITLGGYGMVSIQPPMVYVTMNKAHYTNAGVKENGFFSVNVPSAAQIQKMDYCGLVSGRDTDKSQVFTPFYGADKKAPMIRECPVNVLCKVSKTVDLPNNDVFIGEVLEVYINKDCLTDGKPDPKKIGPIMLMGSYYWELGGQAGVAYREGQALMRKK